VASKWKPCFCKDRVFLWRSDGHTDDVTPSEVKERRIERSVLKSVKELTYATIVYRARAINVGKELSKEYRGSASIAGKAPNPAFRVVDHKCEGRHRAN